MPIILRKKAIYRNLYWLGLAMVFGYFALLPAAVADARADRKVEAAIFFSAMGCIFGGMAAIGLLDYYRSALVVDGDLLCQRGLLRTSQVHLREVQALSWAIRRNYKVIVLSTMERRLKVFLSEYQSNDLLSLIRHLWSSIPAAKQVNWDWFCLKTALPLRKAVEGQFSPNENLASKDAELTSTPRRWDVFFLVAAGVILPITVLLWIITDDLSMFAIFPAIGLLWALMRLMTPKEGFQTKRFSQDSQRHQFLGWSMVLMMPMSTLCGIAQKHPVSAALYWSVLIVWAIAAFFLTQRWEKECAAKDAANVQSAAIEWAAGEATTKAVAAGRT